MKRSNFNRGVEGEDIIFGALFASFHYSSMTVFKIYKGMFTVNFTYNFYVTKPRLESF